MAHAVWDLMEPGNGMTGLTACLLVGAGGFAGSASRYLLSVTLYRTEQLASLGTFAANVAGCFVIGLLAGLTGKAGWMTGEMRLLLATGFCGGFTTMSSYLLEAHHLLRAGNLAGAVAYAGGTLALSAAALVAGLHLAGAVAR